MYIEMENVIKKIKCIYRQVFKHNYAKDAHTHTHTHTHAHAHARTRTHARTHARTRTHTHTEIKAQLWAKQRHGNQAFYASSHPS